jgi:hypothetical protein
MRAGVNYAEMSLIRSILHPLSVGKVQFRSIPQSVEVVLHWGLDLSPSNMIFYRKRNNYQMKGKGLRTTRLRCATICRLPYFSQLKREPMNPDSSKMRLQS